jgi:uncharacterized membrane protein
MIPEKIKPEWFFAGVTLFILLTDITVLASIPFCRGLFTIMCFLFLPGVLLLLLFKMNTMSFTEKFVLSVGLSVSFLIFIGIVINFLLYAIGYSQPLLPIPLTVSYTFVLMILLVFVYLRNKTKIYYFSIKKYVSLVKSLPLLSPLLFALLFPFFCFFGVYLMNTYGNNILLLFFYLMIPIYLSIIVFYHKKIPEITFPIAITMIGLSVLLSRSLTSNYLIGGDIYSEFYTAQVVQNNYFWNLIADPSMVMDSLGVSFLPTILHSLSGFSLLFIFKFLLIFVISLIPLIIYIFCKKLIGPLKGFLGAFLFIAQISFINLLTGQLRIGLAIFFLVLFVMVFFEKNYGEFNKKFLLIIFGFSVILSYYVTPIILFLLFFLVWLFQRCFKKEAINKVTTSIVVLLGTFFFFWWGIFTNSNALKGYSSFIFSIVDNFNKFFIGDIRNPTIQQMFFVKNSGMITYATTLLNDIVFLIIAIGVIYLLIRWKTDKNFEVNYILLMFFCFIALASIIILPYISNGYSPGRFLIQIFFILIPAFFVGCTYLFSRKKLKFDLKIASILIVFLFLFNSYFIHYVAGQESSEIFDLNSQRREFLYVYDAEVLATKWVERNHQNKNTVFLGSVTQEGNGIFEFANYSAIKDLKIFSFRYLDYFTTGIDYIFLRSINLVKGYGYRSNNLSFPEVFLLDEYTSFIENTNKIYDNNRSEIYH